jgi:hypothetical protein
VYTYTHTHTHTHTQIHTHKHTHRHTHTNTHTHTHTYTHAHTHTHRCVLPVCGLLLHRCADGIYIYIVDVLFTNAVQQRLHCAHVMVASYCHTIATLLLHYCHIIVTLLLGLLSASRPARGGRQCVARYADPGNHHVPRQQSVFL